jgi:ABC-2 type transport system ATP-binding protein
VIAIENVIKTFRRQRVLDRLSLEIGPADRVALIGSNGAGKTTLIRCLLGEYRFQGSIRVDGLSPRSQRREVLARIGFVPQLPPPLRTPVAELIRFAAAVSGSDPTRITSLAERMGLDLADVGHKPFFRLSGGQKQKILSAIAIGRPARLLILDEPTANLDPAARRVLFELLAERRGEPVLISSHRIEEVVGLVNRVVELDHGRVTLDDRVEGFASAVEVQHCRLTLTRPEPAFARAVGEWAFTASTDGKVWTGEVAGPDRLRFLAMLSRYAGLIAAISLEPRLDGAVVSRSGSQQEVGHAVVQAH